MNAQSLLRSQIDHLGWADARVLTSLRDAVAPPPRALELYAHVLGAEHTWVSRILGTTPETAVWPRLSLEDCARLAAASLASLRRIIDAHDDEALSRPVRYVNSAGERFTSTVQEILSHVCLHGAYHRGQVALVMRQQGHEPAPTDYIAFTRGAPAAVRQ